MYRTTRLNFFAPDDPEMVALAQFLEKKFREIGRETPRVEVLSLIQLPKTAAQYRSFLTRVRCRGGDPQTLGLPGRLQDSRFFDPKTRGCVSSNFVFFSPLTELADSIKVITINTDYHGEVKSRGVLSPLMAIMSLIQWSSFGRITHEYFPERLFYDPEWGHLLYDRRPRRVSANVFLERNRGLDFCVKRVSAEEAMRWLLIGRTPSGKFEPLYNAYPDFSGLLMGTGVVGEKLVSAYEEARRGNFSALNPNPRIGQAIYDKLHIRVTLWQKNCKDIPTSIVNGAPGLEITQDINWLLSEHPDAFGPWEKVTVEEFKNYMFRNYQVTYGSKGEWTHINAEERAGQH